MKDILFPYETIRKTQDDFINDVLESLNDKKHLIAHVPTGIGKTAGVLAPLLKYAIDNRLTIFFLTPKHTQHKIAIETLRLIKEKYKIDVIVADFIGKRHMCLHSNASSMGNAEFHDFCNNLVENRTCEFYERFHANKESYFPKHIKTLLPLNVEQIIEIGRENSFCPYEIDAEIARTANVIIADYMHILSPYIRDHLFKKVGKDLGDSILIFDEAHNIDKKARELLTLTLSTYSAELAIKEAKRFQFPIIEKLENIKLILSELNKKIPENRNEILIKKEDFSRKIENYHEMINELLEFGLVVLETQKRSFIHNLANFLRSWLGQDEGFIRTINHDYLKNNTLFNINLNYKCLDPSFITKPLIENSKLVICMSGTLTPASMYKDLLGFNDVKLVEYSSSFPKENQLNLIVPNITTKFTLRNNLMYKRIAKECSEIANEIPGNSIIFFPSYELRNNVFNDFQKLCMKTIFQESKNINKSEKEELIEKFKSFSKTGAVLLAVSSANFGEGIDLIGDFLKCVIIVGIPLAKPDLETQALIDYYNKKFGRGWDYGYIYPAIIKTLQNAGRCIRSETDKGVIVFLDERYSWPKYSNCFPKDKNFIITKLPLDKIKDFFN